MAAAQSVDGEPVRVLSTLATQAGWPEVVRRYEAGTGRRMETIFGPTNILSGRLEAGEVHDVAVLTEAGAETFSGKGVLGRPVLFARSWVGLAVAAGAPRPDISTPEKLISVLAGARSVAYSRMGASGVYFAGLIQRLGIAEMVNAKAVVVPSGFTAERVAAGEAEMAVQQISELMVVKGVDIAGPLPHELQQPTLFAAAPFAGSKDPAAAGRLVALLASPEMRAVWAGAGLEPL